MGRASKAKERRRSPAPPRARPPGPPARRAGTALADATHALEVHEALAAALDRPDPALVKFYDDFMDETARVAREQPDEAKHYALAEMFAPALTGEQYLAMIARQLKAARTWQVTAKISAEVTRRYVETSGRVAYFREGTVPRPAQRSGFIWLDVPLELADIAGNVNWVRAISWGHLAVPITSGRNEPVAGLRITTWGDVAGADYLPPEAAAAHRAVPGQLAIAHSLFIPYETRFRPRVTEEELAHDDPGRWLHTWMAFIVTKAAATRRGHVERHAARRIAARGSLDHAEVTVVTMREAVPHEPEEGHVPQPRDWRWRWTVDEFDRHLGNYRELGYAKHQASPEGPDKLCSECHLPTTPVHTYIKGPKHLPIKAKRRTVYRVSR